jgi:CubicO group peptidase (beta-lactamase class C family)
MRAGAFRLLVALLLLAGARTARADAIDDLVAAQMLAQKIPGLSLAVIRNGEVIKTQAYGLASVELGAATSTITVYPIGALREPFTANLVLMQVEAGAMRLDDPIARYVPATPAAWGHVTLRQLLSHTSGLPASAGGGPLLFPPGTRYAVSPMEYPLLEQALTKASGKPDETLLRERILAPLHMNATRTATAGQIVPNRARGYTHHRGVLENAVETAAAGTTLLSTVEDLTKWNAAIDRGALLKPATLARIWPPTSLPAGATTEDGFGWLSGAVKGRRLIERSGSAPGYQAQMSRYVANGVTVIVLANADDADTGALVRGIFGTFFPDLGPDADRPIPDSEPTVTALVRRVFADLARGTGDPANFTPEAWRLLQTPISESARYHALGAIRSVDLLETHAFPDAGLHTYRYHVAYAGTGIMVNLALDRTGKISGLRQQPD